MSDYFIGLIIDNQCVPAILRDVAHHSDTSLCHCLVSVNVIQDYMMWQGREGQCRLYAKWLRGLLTEQL